MSGTPTVRSRAQQPRSQATFETILVAAGVLFDESGIEATTMEAISRRAEVSIGAVYRFFENREAIVRTLAARWRERIQEVALPQFSDDSLKRDAATVITDFLEGFRQTLDQLPGAKGLLSAVATQPTTEETVLWAAHLERFIQRYAPGLRPARRRRAAYTYQAITAALMTGAAGPGQRIKAQLNETRSV